MIAMSVSEVPSNVKRDYGTWRIAVEPDQRRSKKMPFTPIRQSIFWLRTGQNPNTKDMLEVRTPFVTHLSSENERLAFTRGLEAALLLYRGVFTWHTSDGESQLLVGSYSHERKGMPIMATIKSGENLHVFHTWMPKDSIRDARLR